MVKKRKKKVKSEFAVAGAKIGSKLNIRLPTDYMKSITDYVPGFGTDKECRKWCLSQAVVITAGNSDTPNVIKAAQLIYDWVMK